MYKSISRTMQSQKIHNLPFWIELNYMKYFLPLPVNQFVLVIDHIKFDYLNGSVNLTNLINSKRKTRMLFSVFKLLI